MSASKHRLWQRHFIAGAGFACLGAGTILVSGCTTPAAADLNAAAKQDRQVAKASKSSAAKKAAPQVAAREPSGKARVSDLDQSTSARIVAEKAPSRPDASKPAASNARPQKTQLASATIDPQAAAPKRSQAAKADANTVAAKPRVGASARSSENRTTNEVAGGTIRDKGSIKQTAGNGQSAVVARKKPAERRAVETQRAESGQVFAQLPKRSAARPQSSESKFAAADGVASNHERRRSDRLMDRAHERYRSGYPEEALRLASVAFELEKSGQAVYRHGEERPSDYITWLQSVAATRSSNPPVIRPQGSFAPQVAQVAQSGSTVAAVGAESSGPRKAGEVIRADGGVNATVPANTTIETADAIRSNGAVDLATPSAPRFTTGDQPTIRAGANAGQVEVPPPPTPRSADATLAMANAAAPSVDAPAADGSNAGNTTDKVSDKAAPVSVPAPAEKPAQAPSTAFVALDESPAEADVFAESETPNLMPGSTTQLTIASLVGLVIGVAGMFGLSWWRRQEQRHYAAGK